VSDDLTRPAADVQDVPYPAEVELAAAKEPLAHRRMQRKHAARGQHRPLRTVIDVANLFPILLEADPAHQIVFEDPIDKLPARTMRDAFLPTTPPVM
jgi:hypothetical protein